MTDFDGFDDLADGLAQLRDHFDDAATRLDPVVDDAVRKTAKQVERSAKKNLKANDSIDTGNLRGSVGYDQVEPGHYLVGTNAEYARHVEYGRGPVVADDGYLRFEVDGEVLYRKSVGPAKPKPFLRPALSNHRSDLARNIERAIAELFAEVFG